jgi:hypothetical protein
VAVRRAGHRLIDNPLGQELFDQAAAVDLLKPVQPQARPDKILLARPACRRDSSSSAPAAGMASGDGMRMAKWRDNEAPVPGRSWLEHLTSYQELRFRYCRACTPHCYQPVTKSSPSAREPDTNRHKSRKLRAEGHGFVLSAGAVAECSCIAVAPG